MHDFLLAYLSFSFILVCMPACRFTCLPVYLLACLPVCRFHLSKYAYLPAGLPACLSTCLPVCLSVSFIYVSIHVCLPV
jgi:hypothetical protein